MRILIAEDEITGQRLLSGCVAELGACEVVDDGEKALQAFVKAHEEHHPFDVLFLDIMMPQMSGHHVLRAVREYENSHAIPAESAVKVIMTTALNDAENVVGAFKSGCEAYIAKPISKRQVIDELKKLGFQL